MESKSDDSVISDEAPKVTKQPGPQWYCGYSHGLEKLNSMKVDSTCQGKTYRFKVYSISFQSQNFLSQNRPKYACIL